MYVRVVVVLRSKYTECGIRVEKPTETRAGAGCVDIGMMTWSDFACNTQEAVLGGSEGRMRTDGRKRGQGGGVEALGTFGSRL